MINFVNRLDALLVHLKILQEQFVDLRLIDIPLFDLVDVVDSLIELGRSALLVILLSLLLLNLLLVHLLLLFQGHLLLLLLLKIHAWLSNDLRRLSIVYFWLNNSSSAVLVHFHGDAVISDGGPLWSGDNDGVWIRLRTLHGIALRKEGVEPVNQLRMALENSRHSFNNTRGVNAVKINVLVICCSGSRAC